MGPTFFKCFLFLIIHLLPIAVKEDVRDRNAWESKRRSCRERPSSGVQCKQFPAATLLQRLTASAAAAAAAVAAGAAAATRVRL